MTKPNIQRESAIVRSKVKDLSKVSNNPDYVGLFACITPFGPNNTPILIKDSEALEANFGDPQLDPSKYRDLYAVKDIVANGIACYITRVESGTPTTFSYKELFTATTSLNGNLKLTLEKKDAKPKSLNLSYLLLELNEVISESPEVLTTLASTRITLSNNTTNKDIISTLNSNLSTYLTFNLHNSKSENGTDIIEDIKSLSTPQTTTSIKGSFNVKLEDYIQAIKQYEDPKLAGNFISELSAPITSTLQPIQNSATFITTSPFYTTNNKNIRLSISSLENTSPEAQAKIRSLKNQTITFIKGLDSEPNKLQVKIGSLDFNHANLQATTSFESTEPKITITLQIFDTNNNQWKTVEADDLNHIAEDTKHILVPTFIEPVDPKAGALLDESNNLFDLNPNDRRSLHYTIKQIASSRKDLTCVFSTPYNMTLDEACEWTSSTGTHSEMWEYGVADTTDYASQAFYCEMYWDWVNWKVTKLVNNEATSKVIQVVPSSFVIKNTLLSFRERGISFPVAGDNGGVLPAEVEVITNPKTKLLRDKLVQYRINPIFATPTRGTQIYGNETLNPQWTDLSAAHIARLLVLIRHRVHDYTETIKFRLNGITTWQLWKNTVSTQVLEPIKAEGGLNWYEVKMGKDTTTEEEIAARKIRGQVRLQFVPDAEIFDLEFTVEASSATLG